jgi:acetyltransferase-like isoleucine patch superfamily enzyme
MKVLKNPYVLLRKIIKVYNLFFLSFFFKKYGKGTRIEKAYFLTPESIELGRGVLICQGARIEGVSYYEGVKFNPLIILEDYVTIQQNVHLTCANRIIIKKHTAIAANVTITDIIHPYEDVSIPIEKQRIIYKKVEIGEECKIYNNALILPGVILGKHCVVAANSVVREGLYPDFSILVGSPAVIIKKYDIKLKKWIKNE